MLLICSLHFIWASNAPSLKHHWPLTRCLSRFFFSRWESSTSWPWARPLRHEHALSVTTIYTIIRRRAVAGSINQSTSDHEIFDQKAYWTRALLSILRPPVSVRVFYDWAAWIILLQNIIDQKQRTGSVSFLIKYFVVTCGLVDWASHSPPPNYRIDSCYR
jgi:hypothetical protein